MATGIAEKIRRSQLWAAYGDALGFMTELADVSLVKRRTGHERVDRPAAWKRLVGGRAGTLVTLPAGTYSDDTQLRLATSRTIRSDGSFDVEAFAKVELPVWRSYALGAGVGTKLAAASLVKSSVNWFSNFYQSRDREYIESGGNGAVMRIQPHAWATRSTDQGVADSILNTITTHGHPRAILGASLHCYLLSLHLLGKSVPESPRSLAKHLPDFEYVVRRALTRTELTNAWLPMWEQKQGRSVSKLLDGVFEELRQHTRVLDQVNAGRESGSHVFYGAVVRELGGLDESTRGCGLRTALISLAATWLFESPLAGLAAIANTLGSDTDSIATLAGALWGASASDDPPGPIQDQAYLEREASRIAAIRDRRQTSNHEYPDLAFWRAPQTELDYLSRDGDRWALAGLGDINPNSSPAIRTRDGNLLQWFQTTFGQTVLVKFRTDPAPPRSATLPRSKNVSVAIANPSIQEAAFSLFNAGRPPDIDWLTDQVIKSGFDPRVLGEALLEVSGSEKGVERAIAFAAIIAKARQVRARRGTTGGK